MLYKKGERVKVKDLPSIGKKWRNVYCTIVETNGKEFFKGKRYSYTLKHPIDEEGESLFKEEHFEDKEQRIINILKQVDGL